MDFNKDDEYKTLVINAFTSCIPYINEIYPNLVKDIPNLGLLQKRTLIKTILATTTNIIDDKTCDIIDKLVKCELNSKGIFDVDTIPPFGKVKQTIISLWLGNIVRLQIDVIVNAVSNPYCLGCNIPLHYCLDSSIHTFAGPRLKNGSKLLIKNSDDWKKPLDTGESRITKAYCLPCKYIIHTKGPICQESTIEDKNNLISCYINSLNLAKSMGLRTIAFSCISSGLHSFQPIESSKIAIDTVKSYLEKPENLNSFDLIVFVVSTSQELKSYMNNQNILLKGQSSQLISQIENPKKKKILLPLSALKGLHYPWILNADESIDSIKDFENNMNTIDFDKLKLLTSIEAARSQIFSNRSANKNSTVESFSSSSLDSELDLPDFTRINSLKLATSLADIMKSDSNDDYGTWRNNDELHTLKSDSKNMMIDAMDEKYDWILLTLSNGSKMQKAILHDLSKGIDNNDQSYEANYLRKLSNIYKPDLAIVQYILERSRLSTKLSSLWRGYQQRKKYRKALLSVRIIQLNCKRILVIEKMMKIRFQQRLLRNRSATKIQTIWRKYICRQKYLKLYVDLSIRVYIQKLEVVKISSLYRGFIMRKRIMNFRSAVIRVQSIWRKVLRKKEYFKKISAIKLQSLLRTQLCKSQYSKIKNAIVKLNALKFKLRRWLKFKHAAILIQTNWRTFKLRCTYLIRLELINIHKRIRFIYLPHDKFHLVVKVVDKLKNALKKRRQERLFSASFLLYFFLKTKMLRKIFLKKRNAILVINKLKSSYREKKRIQNRLFNAALTIYLFLKTKALRKQFIKKRNAISKLKSCYVAKRERDAYLGMLLGINKAKIMFRRCISNKKLISGVKLIQSVIRGRRARKQLSNYIMAHILGDSPIHYNGTEHQYNDSNIKRKIFSRHKEKYSVKTSDTATGDATTISQKGEVKEENGASPVRRFSLPSSPEILNSPTSSPEDNSLSNKDKVPSRRQSSSEEEKGTPIKTSSLISMIFSQRKDDDEISSVYSQPLDNSNERSMSSDIGSPKGLQGVQVQYSDDYSDCSDEDFKLKRNEANHDSDTDDSFASDENKPGSEILSEIMNPDVENTMFLIEVLSTSPPLSPMKKTMYKGNISSILKEKQDKMLSSSSESTVNRQIHPTPSVKWAPDVNFKDSVKKKEESEIMYSENPLNVVYTVPLNVIGGTISMIGGAMTGNWGSSVTEPDESFKSPELKVESDNSNYNPTTEEIMKQKGFLPADSDRISITDSYNISPVMTPRGYNKTPVIESSSDSFTATTILRTLFIDPTQFVWSTKSNQSAENDCVEEAEFAFDNIYHNADPTKLDFTNDHDHDKDLDFQYENSKITIENLKKREEEEEIKMEKTFPNKVEEKYITNPIYMSKSLISSAAVDEPRPEIGKTVSLDNYNPKRKAPVKPFSDNLLKRKINLKFKKSDDLEQSDEKKTQEIPSSFPSIAERVSYFSHNSQPNPNSSPEHFDFNYVHMHPSPIIIAKANLSQEIIKRENTRHSITSAMKPKVNPITPKPFNRFANHVHSLDTGITSSAIPAAAAISSHNVNTTELNIKKYIEQKDKIDDDDDYDDDDYDISLQHSEIFGFQQKLNSSKIQKSVESSSPSTPFSPNSNTLTPGTTTAIKMLTSISGLLIPFESDDLNEQNPVT